MHFDLDLNYVDQDYLYLEARLFILSKKKIARKWSSNVKLVMVEDSLFTQF